MHIVEEAAFNLQQGKMCQLFLTTLLSFIPSTCKETNGVALLQNAHLSLLQIEFWPTAGVTLQPSTKTGFIMEIQKTASDREATTEMAIC